jgi:Cys-tRNA(Pro)/Cys-tRNA(Cys) deacylase
MPTLAGMAGRGTPATGYVAGGISPLGQRRRLPTVLDTSAKAFDTVFCSAGRRGLEVELVPADLVTLLDAISAPIAQLAP